jgi:hypothetical protein
MPFINETVSDADIDHYGLPFKKGTLQYFTHDRETQRYLWGGMHENPAYDDIREGRFQLFTHGILYAIAIEPGEVPTTYKIKPCRLEWKAISNIRPEPGSAELRRQVLDELKEALLVYGIDGMENEFTPDRQILFGF